MGIAPRAPLRNPRRKSIKRIEFTRSQPLRIEFRADARSSRSPLPSRTLPIANCFFMATQLNRQVQRLHELSVRERWIFVSVSWLMLTPLAIWRLREEFALWRSHFTFAAVRYAFHFDLYATLSVSFCVGITTSVLLWQSRNILFGFSRPYRWRLVKQVRQIRAKGPRHPLWEKVVAPDDKFAKKD